jgi:dihydroxyacetone kinase
MTAAAVLVAEDVRRGLLGACAAVIVASSVLSALDALAGDGDLGVSMEIGFTALQDALAEQGGLDIGALLTVTGATIGRAAPSTLGTLLGMAFTDAGRVSAGMREIDGPGIVKILHVLSAGVMRRGRVEAGQRTIADAMVTSCEDAAQAGDDPVAALREAAAGAARGAHATAEMAPSVGRAVWVGDRARGSPDAGATAWAVLLDGFYHGVAAQSM